MANKFDLTSQNISQTFQRLTQITGSDSSNIFNAVGDPVNQIRMTGSIVLQNTADNVAFLQLDNYTSLPDPTNKLHARGGHLYWGEAFIASGSEIQGITALVEDNSPQLGGFLDVNTNDIRGWGNIDLNGSASFVEIKANSLSQYNSSAGLTFNGNITASGHISASGTIYADEIVLGSGTGGAGAGLTSEGDLVVTGDIAASGNITASAILIKSDDIVVDAIENFFLIKSGSFNALKVNEESVMVLGGFHFEPTAVPGGFHYRVTDDEFYVGKNN